MGIGKVGMGGEQAGRLTWRRWAWGRWTWGRWSGQEMGRWEVGRRGGTGFCKDDPFVLGIPSLDSCRILSWNPVLGAPRILQPRKMEKSHLR